jgi:hypothetical protein
LHVKRVQRRLAVMMSQTLRTILRGTFVKIGMTNVNWLPSAPRQLNIPMRR